MSAIKACLIVTFFLLVISITALAVVSLIMSTGKFWKCPGNPRILQWLLGFGIYGVLFVWLALITVKQSSISFYLTFSLCLPEF